jgi:isoquinoline 1-oxidoreductase alpha subunit
MIMAAVALLHRNPKPERQEVIRTMEGNLCRCGTYLRIISAIEIAAGRGVRR